MNNSKDLVGLFKEIVSISSVSGKEDNVRDFLVKRLTSLGYKANRDKIGSVLFQTKSSRPKLLLCAHMDTVSPGENIEPVQKDGYIVSKGKTVLGADNKAAIAAIITAIEDYASEKNSLPNVEVLFSVKEETGGGLEFFPFKSIKSKKGLTFDSAKPLGHAVIAGPYIYNFNIEITGRAAHSSTPEEGLNSLIPSLNVLSKLKQGRLDGKKTTVNIGVLNMGTGINTIPEKFVINGEVRSLDKKYFDKKINEIKNLIKKTKIKYPKYKISLTFDGYCAGYKLKPNSKLLNLVKKVNEKLNLKTKFETTSGISDANPLNEAGVETINMADGVEFPHTTNERIKISNLRSLKDTVSLMLLHLG